MLARSGTEDPRRVHEPFMSLPRFWRRGLARAADFGAFPRGRLLTSRSTRWFIGLASLLLALRFVAQGMLPLMHQEAYYWMYAQHPSLSYYDHPPMVAWVIGLGTAVFGDREWGVRFVGGALMVLNGPLMYAFARQWWGRRVALASALFVEMAPAYFGIGLIATMDPALLTFWLVALNGFSLAVRRGSAAAWYLCGFGLGGALLSKYTGVMLIPGVGALLLAHAPWRRHLRSPHPYLAALLGIAMFSPVLIWNAQHDWASFRFQFMTRIARGSTSHLKFVANFLLLQVAVATPIVLAGAALLARRAAARRRMSARTKVAFAFAVPLLLSVAQKAWSFPVHLDWTAPAYLALTPAALHAASLYLRASRRLPRRPRQDWARLTLQVSMAINLAFALFLLVVQPRTRWLSLFGPWDQLAATVERYEDALESQTGRDPLIIVDDKYELASLLAFYRNRIDAGDRAATMTVNRVALTGTSVGFKYWTNPKDWQGMDCIYVNEGGVPSPELASRFASVRTVWTGVASNGVEYCILECRGYRSL